MTNEPLPFADPGPPAGTPPPEPAEDPTILCFTDPLRSGCWRLEPALRRLLFSYGPQLRTRHVYVGLLPSWDYLGDLGPGVRTPDDVAAHWAEADPRFPQPIDPAVWHRDPPGSSFPASVAAAGVRLVDPDAEDDYLRRVRQLVFLEGRNIARREVLLEAADSVGVSRAELTSMLADGSAEDEFRRDLALKAALDVRSYPTVIAEAHGQRQRLRGPQRHARLERMVQQVAGLTPARDVPDAAEALAAYSTGTTEEFAQLLEVDADEADSALSAAGGKYLAFGATGYWRAT